MRCISSIRDTIPRVLNYCWKEILLLDRFLAKESELCSTELDNPASRKLMRRSPKLRQVQCTFQKEVIPVGERKWNDIPSCESFKGDSLSAEISKMVLKLVRHYDQDERETDGAAHWNSMETKMRKAFQRSRGRKFSDTDWPQHICEGSNKMRSKYFMNSKNS